MSAVSKLIKEQRKVDTIVRSNAALQDCLFLALVVLLSLILYVFRLGFYSDDWVFLSLLHMSDDQSLPGLYQALYAGDVVIRQRPVQMIYLVLLYWLFGLDPFGYHIANGIMLVAISILFYLVIRELRQSRWLALSISLVYILLPHYSTDRFWVAAFQATVSILFYFLSLYADLRALRDFPARLWRWKILSVGSLLASGLAYEVTLPLFLLNPLLVWYSARQTYGSVAGKRFVRSRATALFAGNLLALLLVVTFKALVTIRTNIATDLVSHFINIATGAVRVNYATYGLGLPYIIWWVLRHNPPVLLLILSVAVGLVIFHYLHRISTQPEHDSYRRTTWPALTALGLLVFALGYSVFIVNADIWFTSTSLGNRVAIAAAIGVTMTFVGLLGWVTDLVPSKQHRQKLFSLLVSLVCVSGFMINNTLANFWITAYQQQQLILNDILEHVPALPANSTLVLDAVCLEHGGAYIFTGKRDLAATLRMAYGDPSLWATAITNRPKIEEEGLAVLTYRNYDFYPYVENLFLYNFAQKKLYRLTDVESTRQYFHSNAFVPEQACSPGFAWGWNSR